MSLLVLTVLAVVDPTTFVIAAAISAPIGAYLIAVRRLSGRIGSSDAHDLWEESKSIRDWSSQRIDALVQENEELRERLERVETRLTVALARVAELEAVDA